MANLATAPAFFVPTFAGEATSPEIAERLYERVRRSAQRQIGWQATERRIFRIGYMQAGREETAEVGSRDNAVGEVCIAILETPGCYLLCTENRGAARGMPIMVAKPQWIVEFDD